MDLHAVLPTSPMHFSLAGDSEHRSLAEMVQAQVLALHKFLSLSKISFPPL